MSKKIICPFCGTEMNWHGQWDDDENLYTEFVCPNCDSDATQVEHLNENKG